jgi:hypothetical protein
MIFSPTVYKSNQHIKTSPHMNYLLIYLPTRVNPEWVGQEQEHGFSYV